MRLRKAIKILMPVIMLGIIASLSPVVGQQKVYTQAEINKMMEATINEDIIGVGTDPLAINKLLQMGQIIIINEHTKKVPWLITGGVLTNASPETLYSVIMDTDNYSEIQPFTEKAEVKELAPNLYELHLTLNIKIIKGISVPVKYSIIHYNQPPLRTDWAMGTGRFEENLGFYQFVPISGGKQSMLFYTLYSLPRIPIVTKWIKNDPNLEKALNLSVAIMVPRAIKKRAEMVENREPFVPGKSIKGNVAEIMARDPKTINLLLKRGGLVIIEDTSPMMVTTVVSMNAPPEEVYDFVTQFENYPCYQTQMKKTEVREKTDNSAKVFFDLDIDYGIVKIPLTYTMDYTLERPGKIAWKWAEGDVPTQKGSWTFTPLLGGKRTLAFFRSTFDVKALPGLMGSGIRSAIKTQASLEPAILAGQAMIQAQATRDLMNMSKIERKKIIESCNVK